MLYFIYKNIYIKYMTILITGYNGYIGSHIYEYLLNKYTVYGIDIYDFDLKDY